MPDFRGNKGEWSEIYVFLRLLELGQLEIADENGESLGLFYEVIHIIRNESADTLKYVFDKERQEVEVRSRENDHLFFSLGVSEFKREADRLYSVIRSSSNSFSSNETENFLHRLGINNIKANSAEKADIHMMLRDPQTAQDTEQGFSIKSRMGGASTLLNASAATNFTYRISGTLTDETIERFNSTRLFSNKFKLLNENGNTVEYVKPDNQIFHNNLIMIDSNLPKIIGLLLLYHYADGISELSEASHRLAEDNPLGFDPNAMQPFYIYKIKKFLSDVALGMTPSEPWDGQLDANGGYVIVKEDGEILCYSNAHVNEFENYLFNNTKFETASTERHRFGSIYRREDGCYLKLNLQIRFIN